MLRLTNLNSSRCQRWCSAIVLLAVCSLTVSVATRYSYFPTANSSASTTIQKDASPRRSCQRLLNDAAVWIPPAISSDALPAFSVYPRIMQPEPGFLSPFFEKSLYNRPPPSI